MKKLEGKLDTFYETGMEGLAFVFIEDGKEAWEALNFLKEGDVLTVYERDKIYWSSKISTKMAELYSDFNGTGYRDNNWIEMFTKNMKANLYKIGEKE